MCVKKNITGHQIASDVLFCTKYVFLDLQFVVMIFRAGSDMTESADLFHEILYFIFDGTFYFDKS